MLVALRATVSNINIAGKTTILFLFLSCLLAMIAYGPQTQVPTYTLRVHVALQTCCGHKEFLGILASHCYIYKLR